MLKSKFVILIESPMEKRKLYVSISRNFNISLFFALKAQVQKTVKTAMDCSFRDFGKVSQDGITC